MRRSFLVGLWLVVGSFSIVPRVSAQAGCSGQVDFDGSAVTVAPSGGDDTDNIECAIQTAMDNAVPTVKLLAGNFSITSMEIAGFAGTLQGNTQTSTTVSIQNGSVNCNAMRQSGKTPASIKFVGGEPRVRFMTLTANSPCTSPDTFHMIHFTGQDAGSACGNDVIFGSVDRVTLDGASSANDNLVGVGAFAEGHFLGGCRDTLLGTFKLNRSTIDGVAFGVATSVRGAGQVDINFNEFSDNTAAVFIANANQSTTVTGNGFVGSSGSANSYFGVLAFTDNAGAPNANRLVVHKNTFDLSDTTSNDEVAIGIGLFNDQRIANLGVVVTENDLDVGGPEAVAVFGDDISAALVSNNVFRSANTAGVYVFGDEVVARDWAIVGNNFGPANGAIGDIVLDQGTAACIVGPAQGASVSDSGDNVVLNDAAVKRGPTGMGQRVGERVRALTASWKTQPEVPTRGDER